MKLSYTMTRNVLQVRGLVEKGLARGKYRRRRERRPMRGDAVASGCFDACPDRGPAHAGPGGVFGRRGWTHAVRALRRAGGDGLDAGGAQIRFGALGPLLRVLYGPREPLLPDDGREAGARRGAAGPSIASAQGAGHPPHPGADAPGAGSERAVLRDAAGRLPQELRVAGIKDYATANRYLEERFMADFNGHFAAWILPPRRSERRYTPGRPRSRCPTISASVELRRERALTERHWA